MHLWDTGGSYKPCGVPLGVFGNHMPKICVGLTWGLHLLRTLFLDSRTAWLFCTTSFPWYLVPLGFNRSPLITAVSSAFSLTAPLLPPRRMCPSDAVCTFIPHVMWRWSGPPKLMCLGIWSPLGTAVLEGGRIFNRHLVRGSRLVGGKNLRF